MECKDLIISKLCNLPSDWRDQIADVICNYVKATYSASLCPDFKACETLTSLSSFTVNSTDVCISFKDEAGVTVSRCFDYNDVINNWLNQLDPNCLGTRSQWVAMTHSEKIQAMVDQICNSCTDDPTTTTTTTTTSTTTTTTLAPCMSYSLENFGDGDVTIQFKECTAGLDTVYTVPKDVIVYICAIQGSIQDLPNTNVVEVASCPGGTTSTTTTTTSSTTTTTTVA